MMMGYRDEAGRFYSLDQAVVAYQQFTPRRYEVGDWVAEPGLITHHLRIIECVVDDNSFGWYRIFDTTLQDGHGDYKLRDADELEAKSRYTSDRTQMTFRRSCNGLHSASTLITPSLTVPTAKAYKRGFIPGKKMIGGVHRFGR